MTKKQKILIVDDEDAIRHSASFMLRHAGYDVETFASGPEFLAKLTRETEGCVLLDVRMPEMDGLTVLERTREISERLPVIILTGHGDVATAVSAMKIGATDFLEKPFEKATIIGSIEDAFFQSRCRDSAPGISKDGARESRCADKQRAVMFWSYLSMA